LRDAKQLYEASIGFRRDPNEKALTEEVETAMTGRLKVKAIDWDKQMLLVVSAGEQLALGYRVEVTGVKVKSGVLRVSWKLHEPKRPIRRATSHPGVVVLVPRHKGRVVFEQVK